MATSLQLAHPNQQVSPPTSSCKDHKTQIRVATIFSLLGLIMHAGE